MEEKEEVKDIETVTCTPTNFKKVHVCLLGEVTCTLMLFPFKIVIISLLLYYEIGSYKLYHYDFYCTLYVD